MSSKSFPDGCIVAKFVMDKKEIKEDGRVRGRNFVPRAGEDLSTAEVTNLTAPEICAHGREHVDGPVRKNIGYVLLRISSVEGIGLQPIYDNDPHRHVSIRFPVDDVKRKELGKRLELECLPFNDAPKECFQAC